MLCIVVYSIWLVIILFISGSGTHLVRHVPSPSFPTRPYSDLDPMPPRRRLPWLSFPRIRRAARAFLALAAAAMSSAALAADAPNIRVGVQAAPPDEVYKIGRAHV